MRNAVCFLLLSCGCFLAAAGLAQAGHPNLLVLPRMTEPPKIDGRLAEGEWDRAVQLHGCILRSDGMLRKKRRFVTSCFVGRDARKLYLCFRVPLRPGEYPYNRIFLNDCVNIVGGGQVIEFYVQPPPQPGDIPHYFQFLGNLRGVYWDCHFMPTIGQGLTGWDARFTFKTTVTEDAWVSELSVPVEDLRVPAADIGDGLELRMDLCRDGGAGPLARSYNWAFHNYRKYMPVRFRDAAPAVHVLNFGDFDDVKCNPEVELVAGDAAVDATVRYELFGDTPDPKTKEWVPLQRKEETVKLRPGARGVSAVELPVEKGQSGHARITVVQADGSLLFRRHYKFKAEPLPEPKDKAHTPIPLRLDACWAPSLGKVHVLADILEMDDPYGVTVDVVVNGPQGDVLGTGTVSRFRYGGGTVDLALRGGRLAPGTYTVEAVARNAAGREVARASDTYERTVYEWEESQVGYADSPIRPWTPLEADGNRVDVWGRTYRLNALGLPQSIVGFQPEPTRGPARREMLSGPVRLRVVSDGRQLDFVRKELTALEASSTEALYAASARAGHLLYTMTGRMEYDGFYKIDLVLRPTRPTPLESVVVEVPLPGDMCRLLHSVGEMMRSNNTAIALRATGGVLWDSKTAARNGIVSGNFLPWLWVGDEDRGIGWMAENPASWVLDHEKPVLEVVRRGTEVFMRIHLLNRPAVCLRPIQASFSLQATPVRPRPPGGSWRDHTNVRVDYWGNSRGRGGGWGTEIARNPDAAMAHAERVVGDDRTMRFFAYQCPKLGDQSRQEYKDFKGEWMILPDYGNKTTVKSYADYALWCYDWWHRTCRVTGMYFDNTFPIASRNMLNGLAWRDAGGRVQAGYRCFSQREFFKRVATWLRTLPENRDATTMLYLHMTDASVASYLGWGDFWLAGESGGMVAADIENPDAVDRWGHDKGLARLRAYAIGRQYGAMMSWCTGYHRFGTVFGLHDIQRGWGSHNVYVNKLGNGTRNDLDMTSPDLGFMPYWDARDWYDVRAGERIFCTAWTLPGRARVQISNLGPADAAAEVAFDLDHLGVPKDCVVSRATDGTVIPHEGGRLTVAVPRHAFEVLLFVRKGVFETGTPPDIEALNTGKSLPAFRDDFTTLKPVWKTRWNPRPSWGSRKENNATFTPDYYGALRIITRGGYAHAVRPFGRDSVSVRIRLYRPAGRQCGNPYATHPMTALYWNEKTFIKCVLHTQRTADRGRGGTMFFSVRHNGRRTRIACPEPGLANWVRYDLAPEAVELYVSADLATWTRAGSVPRKGRKGAAFAGAPTHLFLGIGQGGKPMLQNESPGITDSYSFFDELIVEELPAGD